MIRKSKSTDIIRSLYSDNKTFRKISLEYASKDNINEINRYYQEVIALIWKYKDTIIYIFQKQKYSISYTEEEVEEEDLKDAFEDSDELVFDKLCDKKIIRVKRDINSSIAKYLKSINVDENDIPLLSGVIKDRMIQNNIVYLNKRVYRDENKYKKTYSGSINRQYCKDEINSRSINRQYCEDELYSNSSDEINSNSYDEIEEINSEPSYKNIIVPGICMYCHNVRIIKATSACIECTNKLHTKYKICILCKRYNHIANDLVCKNCHTTRCYRCYLHYRDDNDLFCEYCKL